MSTLKFAHNHVQARSLRADLDDFEGIQKCFGRTPGDDSFPIDVSYERPVPGV